VKKIGGGRSNRKRAAGREQPTHATQEGKLGERKPRRGNRENLGAGVKHRNSSGNGDHRGLGLVGERPQARLLNLHPPSPDKPPLLCEYYYNFGNGRAGATVPQEPRRKTLEKRGRRQGGRNSEAFGLSKQKDAGGGK